MSVSAEKVDRKDNVLFTFRKLFHLNFKGQSGQSFPHRGQICVALQKSKREKSMSQWVFLLFCGWMGKVRIPNYANDFFSGQKWFY
jgi:hypothetical protein